MNNLTNKWLYFPWIKGTELDYLIHEDYVSTLNGLGVVLCIDDDGAFLTVRNKDGFFKVRKEGVKKILPSPKFTWGDTVHELNKPEVKATIDDFFWHHKHENYLYYININGKKKTKQISDIELVTI